MVKHTVKSGDTLSELGQRYGVNYMDIAKTNKIADPNKIYTGQVLEIPGAASASVPSSAGSTSLKGNSGSGVQMKSPYLGVSDQAYTDYMNSAYTRSDDLQSIYNQADSLLEQYQNTTNGERQQKINSILEEYENRDPFSYDFATDPMFQNMLASYQQMGQSAMKDSIAQSSALTGGYANSWAQTAGQQSYNQHIQEAFNNLPEYYQLALETYEREEQKLLDMYGLLDSEQQKELDQILNRHSIIYGKARDFESDERSDYSTNLTKQWNDITLSNSEAWKNKEYNDTQSARATELAMEEAKMQANGYEKQSDGSWKYVGKDEDEEAFEYDGPLYQYLRDGDDGEKIFRNLDSDEEISLPAGTNPYGAPSNDDTAYGMLSNGYQPNNIDGQTLEKTGARIIVNGKTQNVWEKEGSGDWYYWDGFTGQYYEVDKEDDRILK